MSLVSTTAKHRMLHVRYTETSGPSGGKQRVPTELGVKVCTLNPDSDFESMDFSQRNQQVSASIYFSYDPETHAEDYLQLVAVRSPGGVWTSVSDGPVYRVESQLNFQHQNRLWRVRATEREALA